MHDGAVMAVEKGSSVSCPSVSRHTCMKDWNPEYELEFSKIELSRDGRPLIVAAYGNDISIFVPHKNAAYVVNARNGTYKPKRFVDFGGDQTCTAIATKRNIACVIAQEFVYVVRLDRLLCESNGSTAASPAKKMKLDDVSKPCFSSCTQSEPANDANDKMTQNNALIRVRAPALPTGMQLTSAVVYGKHLFAAQSPVVGGTLKLHSTKLDDLLQMRHDDCPLWQDHVKTLGTSVKRHISDRASSVSLFCTKLKNPGYVKK